MEDLLNTKYAIAKKHFKSAYDSDFISTLAHEFAGEKEVLGYMQLKDAIHFDTVEEAKSTLSNLPSWALDSHGVVEFRNFGIYYII